MAVSREAVIDRLDWVAVRRGAGVATLVGLVGGLSGRALGSTSSLASVFVIIILGGMGVGGFIAGREQPDVALTAGGIASLLASIVLQALNVAYAAVRGTLTFNSLITVVFIVMVFTSMGLLGGYLAFRRRPREAEPT